MELDGIRQWCARLPKVELHAHLNGSIRDATLLELAEEHGKRGSIRFSEIRDIILKDVRSLEECFKLFDVIHTLTADHGVVTRITREVIEDFAAENVVYLELRTTPKKNAMVNMSKRSYMEAVIDGLKNAREQGVQMHVRLLLSIDRREDVSSAIETVELALQLREFGVVGVDLSGNPVVGNWKTFVPALTLARKHGLPVTLHCGEVHNPDEVQAMLSFSPERLGHLCVLQDSQWQQLLRSPIPVEICLTSNILTKSVASFCDHHFAALYVKNHPMVLCTDDRGVFATSLSREYALAAVSFGLSKPQLLALAKKACDFIFAEEPLKLRLREIFCAFESSISF